MATCSRHAVGPLNICCNSNDWNNNCACKYCIYERGFLDYEDEVDCSIILISIHHWGQNPLKTFTTKLEESTGSTILAGWPDVLLRTIRNGLRTLSCLQLKTSFLNEHSFAGS